MNDPFKKLNHLTNFMQQMMVELGSSRKNYLMITVAGNDIQSHLASFQQAVREAGVSFQSSTPTMSGQSKNWPV
ncbi:hypothetical protein LRAMOSA09466 [Lichtheimia ramosa]|uniref:Uncharacterized protein n=1 Tax=Lichtheimia ramosa TaxID=688394 RepID=A0A077WIP3_9FUNG|nr:hypothetical protein LRAMOSA09466 [Lichtheimia ramosa]